MKLNKTEAHEKLKDVKVMFTSLDECQRIQERLFECGYDWCDSGRIYTDCMFVYTDAAHTISRGCSIDEFEKLPQTKMSPGEILDFTLVDKPVRWCEGDHVRVLSGQYSRRIGRVVDVRHDKYVVSSGDVDDGTRIFGLGPASDIEVYEEELGPASPAPKFVDCRVLIKSSMENKCFDIYSILWNGDEYIYTLVSKTETGKSDLRRYRECELRRYEAPKFSAGDIICDKENGKVWRVLDRVFYNESSYYVVTNSEGLYGMVSEANAVNLGSVFKIGDVVKYGCDGKYTGKITGYDRDGWIVKWEDSELEKSVITNASYLTIQRDENVCASSDKNSAESKFHIGDTVRVDSGGSSFIAVVGGYKLTGECEYYVVNKTARVTGWYSEKWLTLVRRGAESMHTTLVDENTACKAFCWGRCNSKLGCETPCEQYSKFKEALKNK